MGPPGAHRENPQWPSVLLQIPLSTARAGGGGLPGGGLGLGWLQASPSAGDTICSCRGYLIAPALMLGGRDREIRG